MQNNPDLDLLERDLEDGESQTVEFKEDFPRNAKELVDVIASFATSNPGRLYMYISPNGVITPNNLETGEGRDSFQLRLNGIVNAVKPAIRVKVTFITKGQDTVARIDVPKGSEAVYFSNSTPYLRDLSQSRPVKPEEVKELYRQYFEQQRAPKVTATEGVVEDQEVARFLVRLLFELSDAQLALSDIEEHYVNPQLNQLQYDLGNSADGLLSLLAQPVLKRVNLDAKELKQIAKELKGMENFEFYLGKSYWDTFNSKGKSILDLINPIIEFVRTRVMVSEASKREYKKMVEVAINELKTDWEMAQDYQYGDELERLRDSFRRYGYRFHKLANLHEADEIDDIRQKLLKLSSQLRKLSSVDGWGISTIGFSHIEHVRPNMENNLKVADEILAVLE